MRTAKRITTFFILIGLASPAYAQSTAELLDMEAALLHRGVDLRAVKVWSEKSGKWQNPPPPNRAVTVLHLWAVECQPCVEELPLIQRIMAAWQTNPDVQFYMISETLNRDTLVDFWKKHALTQDNQRLQSTDNRIRDALETQRQPLTLLLDKNQVVRQAFVGSLIPRSNQFSSALIRLLKVAHPAPVPASARRKR